jgi:hypothetical protein
LVDGRPAKRGTPGAVMIGMTFDREVVPAKGGVLLA